MCLTYLGLSSMTFPLLFILTLLNNLPPSDTTTATATFQEQYTVLLSEANFEGMNLCAYCKETVTHVQEILGNETNQKILILSLQDMCDAMAGPISRTCRRFVEYYVPEIISIVLDLDPEHVCMEIGLCPSELLKHYNLEYKLVSSSSS